MFSVLSCCSYLLLVFRFYCVAQETDTNKRYILDEDFKPAIFGSNKFNPVLQIFEDINEDQTTHTDQNVTSLQVTEIGIVDTTITTTESAKRVLFRQHINSVKPTLWWTRTRPRPNNITRTVPVPKQKTNSTRGPKKR